MNYNPLAASIALLIAIQPSVFAQDKPEADKPLHKFLSVDDKSKLSLAYTLLDICEEAAAKDVDRYNAHRARPPDGNLGHRRL
jgi:hypothetical protein